AHEKLFDQRHLRSETGCACRSYQPSRPRADDDEIVALRRGGILPVGGMNVRHESRIVRIRRADQNRLGVDIHKADGPVSLALIFFASVLRARRVTKIDTTTVASSPTP